MLTYAGGHSTHKAVENPTHISLPTTRRALRRWQGSGADGFVKKRKLHDQLRSVFQEFFGSRGNFPSRKTKISHAWPVTSQMKSSSDKAGLRQKGYMKRSA